MRPVLGRWAALAVRIDHEIPEPPPVITRVLDGQGSVLAERLGEAAPPSTVSTGSGRWRTEYVFELPGSLYRAGHQLVHVIDPDDELAETDENDNTRRADPPVRRGAGAGPGNVRPAALSRRRTAGSGRRIPHVGHLGLPAGRRRLPGGDRPRPPVRSSRPARPPGRGIRALERRGGSGRVLPRPLSLSVAGRKHAFPAHRRYRDSGRQRRRKHDLPVQRGSARIRTQPQLAAPAGMQRSAHRRGLSLPRRWAGAAGWMGREVAAVRFQR